MAEVGSSPAPLVSVVVPTKDSGATIEACLRSIRNQTYPAVELIVVDNDSADGTFDVARRLADVALRGGPERSAQRNKGTEGARGEWILWIDSDMELPPDVVASAVAAADEAGAVAVFIPEVTVGEGFWTRARALERRCYLGEAWIESPRLIRREYLQRTGGFVEWLSGTEDAELRMRLFEDGSLLARTDALIVHDEGRLKLFGVARKRYYYGLGLANYRGAHPGAMSNQAKATAKAFLRNWKLLAADPVVASGVVVMRVAEVAAYAAGAAAGRPRKGRGSVRPAA